MDDRTQNRLNMVGGVHCSGGFFAHQPVWLGQEPAAFEADFGVLKTDYAAAQAVAAQAAAAITGTADQKDLAETALEDALIKLRAALRSHYKKTQNLVELAKVDLSPTKIQKLRDQDLSALATVVLGLANTAKTETGATSRGVTDARIATLDAAATAFQTQLNAPRSQIADRGSLLRDLETRAADLVDQVTCLDDLVEQFDGSDAGLLFMSAWESARVIVDAGHGPSPPSPPPPPPSPPSPPPPSPPPPSPPPP